MRRSQSAAALLLSSALVVPHVAWGQAEAVHSDAEQQAAVVTAIVQELVDEEDEIVVEGQRPRGSAFGNVPPEFTLDAADVRALGASTISELLEELAPQLRSGRGGRPLMLLEGRKVSSHREVYSIPAEAILRVEILPEEVALKYGASPDQKVLNIILRQRFRAVTLEGGERLATAGGGQQAEGSFNLMQIRPAGRLNIEARYTQTEEMMESKRNIFDNNGEDTMRTLIPFGREMALNTTYARSLSDRIGLSLNSELTATENRSLTGLGGTSILGFEPVAMERDSTSQAAHFGATLNADGRYWRGTLTAQYTHEESRVLTERGFNLFSATDGSVTGVGLIPVTGGYVGARPADVSRSRTDTGTADITVNGSLYRLPAGNISLTASAGGAVSGYESRSVRSLVPQATDLNRTEGFGSLSLDIPLVDSSAPFIGRLSANANVEGRDVSDFGGVYGYGYGLSWAPDKGISLNVSYKQAQKAPGIGQLGNPMSVTPMVPVFDYRNGETVFVNRLSGGNPNLSNSTDKDWRIGFDLASFIIPEIGLSLEYNHRRATNVIGALPGTTAMAELAFPDRFIRDASGRLLSIDTTPINLASQSSSVLRWGLNFSKRLKMPQSQVEAYQRRSAERLSARQAESGAAVPGAQAGSGGAAGASTSASAPPAPRAGGPRGAGGGNMGGRISLSVYHSIHLKERARLAAHLPSIDLLNGGTLGERAGQPRHEVEVRSGFSQAGFGARLSGKWESAVNIIEPGASPASNLRFSDHATVDLRLFANLGQMPALISDHQWARGMRVSIAVTNVLNTRQKVVDGTGNTPFAYRPAFMDPLGRTVMISLRKQFSQGRGR